jgi:hypothetical protein
MWMVLQICAEDLGSNDQFLMAHPKPQTLRPHRSSRAIRGMTSGKSRAELKLSGGLRGVVNNRTVVYGGDSCLRVISCSQVGNGRGDFFIRQLRLFSWR